MAVYVIRAEHVGARGREAIREFCKKQKIRVTKLENDEIFSNQVLVRVSADPKKKAAAKVRDFIWNEVNNGAWCEVTRHASR